MNNLSTSDVKFPAGATEGLGFLASPPQGGPYPGLVVIQEFWGVNEHIKDVTQRLASEGFVALAADMYDGRITKDANEARSWLMSLNPQASLDKLNGAVDALKKHPQAIKDKIGVIGFCMGGFLSLNLACHNKDVRAAAAFYGRVPPDSALKDLRAPVLYVFGEKDHHIPADDVNRLEQHLKKTNSGEVVRYPEADHAFMNDTRPEVYRPEDAKDAWRRAVEFLQKNLT